MTLQLSRQSFEGLLNPPYTTMTCKFKDVLLLVTLYCSLRKCWAMRWGFPLHLIQNWRFSNGRQAISAGNERWPPTNTHTQRTHVKRGIRYTDNSLKNKAGSHRPPADRGRRLLRARCRLRYAIMTRLELPSTDHPT